MIGEAGVQQRVGLGGFLAVEDLVPWLEDILGPEGVVTAPDRLTRYGWGASYFPDMAVFPTSAGQVSQVLSLANKYRVPVLPRGGSSDFRRGLPPYSGGIAVVLERLDRVLEIDEGNHTAVVEAGVILKHLERTLAPHRLFFPPDPVNLERSTIGGAVAVNASGSKKLKYGLTRDSLLGVELVVPTGETINAGGYTVKNVSGYDITRLVAGSWGRLGVITRAILRLKPVPETELVLLISCRTVLDAVEVGLAIVRTGLFPAALDLFDGSVGEDLRRAGNYFPATGGGVLMVVLDGFHEDVKRQSAVVERIATMAHAQITTIDQQTDREKVWQARRSVPAILAGTHRPWLECSAIVPPAGVGQVMTMSQRLARENGMEVKMVSHLGNGHIHWWLGPGQQAITQPLTQMARSLQGTFATHYPDEEDGPITLLIRRIKSAFDPNNILNPSHNFQGRRGGANERFSGANSPGGVSLQ